MGVNPINPAITKNRISILFYVFIIFSGIIIAKLVYLQIFQYSHLKTLATDQQERIWQIPAKRGKIFIKNGDESYPVVLNDTVQLLFADPHFITDKKSVANKLSKIISVEEKELYKLLDTANRYVVLKEEVTVEEADKIKLLNVEGLVLKDKFKRVYPEGSFLSHILGFVNADGIGEYGIEEYLNKDLMGVNGQYRATTDKNGVPILNSNNVEQDAVSGSSVYLTIDRNIQTKVEETLFSAVQRFQAESGTIIVANPKTGEILALANYPNFDPNKYFLEKDFTTFENFSYSRTYEPGSIFKVFTMAAGLNEKTIEPSTTYVDEGQIKINDRVIKNSDLKKHGIRTMTQVLEESLNTGSTWVLEQMGGGKISDSGETKFYDYLTKFGLGQKTGVETNLESLGFIPKPLSVPNHTYATMTFGQSLTVTPIQLIQALGAIANDGTLIKPHVIDKIVDAKGRIIQNHTQEVRDNIITKETAAKLKGMMVSVVDNGHGKKAGVKGYNVAGKTGTAQIAKGGTYVAKANNGSFFGFAPAENPAFVMVVKIEKPKIAWAESSAAPTFGDIADFLLRYLQVPPSR